MFVINNNTTNGFNAQFPTLQVNKTYAFAVIIGANIVTTGVCS